RTTFADDAAGESKRIVLGSRCLGGTLHAEAGRSCTVRRRLIGVRGRIYDRLGGDVPPHWITLNEQVPTDSCYSDLATQDKKRGMARRAQVPVPVLADIRRAPHNRGGGSMRWSYIPRWKFTDSCGRPGVPGALHLGCAHDAHAECHHATRREFLKAGVAIAGAAGFATVVDPREVFAKVAVFPPPPPEVSPIAGLMDTHVHAAPDVFGRSMDDEEVAILYKERGLEALVLKNHVVATADRAWFARKHVAGLKVFGGIVLNSAVGGINPDAVNWMWRMQGGFGRVVWFPTFDADNHVKHFKDAPEAIKVLGADGKVLPAVRDVLKICAAQKLVVHTGHLSPTEALAVIEAGRDAGVSRLV